MDEKERGELSSDYIQGFNDGYLIAKHDPELSEKLKELDADSERMQGFRQGMRELTKEKTQNIYPKWLRNKSDMGVHKDNPEKDKDLGDKDR